MSRPEWVREVHEAFARAGATLHRTNTRAAHRSALGPQALEDALLALGRRGVTILGGCCGVGPRHIHALAKERARRGAGSRA